MKITYETAQGSIECIQCDGVQWTLDVSIERDEDERGMPVSTLVIEGVKVGGAWVHAIEVLNDHALARLYAALEASLAEVA